MSEHEEDLRPANMLGCEISPNPLDPLAPIEAMCRQHHPDEDMEILSRAYTRAVIQHAEQRRRSGEPYIIHPLAVAQILADLGMGPSVVAAGLLHDTVEDTDYTLDECRAEFGDTVAGLVDGRDQADEDGLWRFGAGRDDPQDGRRDEPRCTGARRQARRPCAQCPHLALRQALQRAEEGPRNT